MLPCDSIILDLEDAVAPDAKAEARQRASEVLSGRIFGTRKVVVRVNGPDPDGQTDDLAEDLTAILPHAPDAVLFPKIRFHEDAERAELALAAALAPSNTRLWLMIETPQAVIDLPAIGALARRPHARLEALVMGTNDLAKEMMVSLTPSRLALLHALSATVLAGRAFGLVTLDGVFGDIHNSAGFEGEALQGKGLGFDGKTLIHPAQIDTANRIFSPSAQERARAEAIAKAFEDPANAGRAVLVVEGQMVERLHYEMALRILDR
jgi:citrate lyase subunit beta/citryl-CoA lyase